MREMDRAVEKKYRERERETHTQVLLYHTPPQVISQSSSPLLPAAHAWPLQSLQGAQGGRDTVIIYCSSLFKTSKLIVLHMTINHQNGKKYLQKQKL